MKTPLIQIQLNFGRIKTALVILFFLNGIFLFGTSLHHTNSFPNAPSWVGRLLAQLNLGSENVAASWYSSMLLFLVAITSAFCFLADSQNPTNLKEKVLNIGWLAFTAIFLTLSFDEMGSVHEMIGDTAIFSSLGEGVSGGGWYIFYLLIAAVGLFMMLFFFIKFFRHWPALILAIMGVLLFLSNPLQENLEIGGTRSSPGGWHRPVGFLLLEEGSELFASYCLLLSFTIYLKLSLGKKIVSMGGVPSLHLLVPRRLYINYLVVILVVATIMGSIKLLMPVPNYAGSGIAENWFPSALCFFSFLVALYFYRTVKAPTINPGVYLLAAFSCLGMSLSFGADLYDPGDPVFQLISICMLAGTLTAAALMSLTFKKST